MFSRFKEILREIIHGYLPEMSHTLHRNHLYLRNWRKSHTRPRWARLLGVNNQSIFLSIQFFGSIEFFFVPKVEMRTAFHNTRTCIKIHEHDTNNYQRTRLNEENH